MVLILGEMQHGAANDEIERGFGHRHGLNLLNAETVRDGVRGEAGGHFPHMVQGVGVGVDGPYFATRTEEVGQVAAGAAARVQDLEGGLYPAFEEEIKKVNVDIAEPGPQVQGTGAGRGWGGGRRLVIGHGRYLMKT
jgi:hypothetical protein